MTPRIFAFSTNFWNRLEAWNAWRGLAQQCDPYLVSLFAPPANAGWRTIDKCTEYLRQAEFAQRQAGKEAQP